MIKPESVIKHSDNEVTTKRLKADHGKAIQICLEPGQFNHSNILVMTGRRNIFFDRSLL